MERFEDLYRIEDKYWWAKAHQKVIISLLESTVNLSSLKRILDIGCGGGGLLSRLKSYGQGYGIDLSLKAIKYCKMRQLSNIICGQANSLPIKHESFDVICAVELMEHVEDEQVLLGEFSRIMKKGAILLITAPAFNFLFSKHDEWVGHKRRYTVAGVKTILSSAGFKIIQASYFHMLLFPVLFVMSKWGRFASAAQKKQTVVELPLFLNQLLTLLLCAEIPILKQKISLPFGSSVIVLAQKIR